MVAYSCSEMTMSTAMNLSSLGASSFGDTTTSVTSTPGLTESLRKQTGHIGLHLLRNDYVNRGRPNSSGSHRIWQDCHVCTLEALVRGEGAESHRLHRATTSKRLFQQGTFFSSLIYPNLAILPRLQS